MEQKTIKIAYILVCLFICFYFICCRKFTQVEAPYTSVNEVNVYTTDATAISVLTGIYSGMANVSSGISTVGDFTGKSSISVFCGLSADELTLYSGVSADNFISYYKNTFAPNSSIAGSEHWATLYKYIYICNAAISGLTASNSLSPDVKQQLLGEAKFLRAFFYFYLINLYGDVPLALYPDYKINSALPRESTNKIYEQIITDLLDAKSFLSANYLNVALQKYSTIPSSERVRPTKWAASALLARVYLYTNDFLDAEVEASSVINDSLLFKVVPLNEVFKKNSFEAIWQLQPVIAGHNTEDGWMFILPTTGPNGVNAVNPVYLSQNLVNAFENNDQRKANGNWLNNVVVNGITYFFPYKYKIATLNASVSEYLMVLRLGELFLIRAEARAQQNNLQSALSDLNVIRKRAGLPNVNVNGKDSLLLSILHERQVELFAEWGHRWFDLKRTGNIDRIMNLVTPQKGGIWKTTSRLFPLPEGDIEKNNNLNQNPGY